MKLRVSETEPFIPAISAVMARNLAHHPQDMGIGNITPASGELFFHHALALGGEGNIRSEREAWKSGINQAEPHKP